MSDKTVPQIMEEVEARLRADGRPEHLSDHKGLTLSPCHSGALNGSFRTESALIISD